MINMSEKEKETNFVQQYPVLPTHMVYRLLQLAFDMNLRWLGHRSNFGKIKYPWISCEKINLRIWLWHVPLLRIQIWMKSYQFWISLKNSRAKDTSIITYWQNDLDIAIIIKYIRNCYSFEKKLNQRNCLWSWPEL